MAWLHTFWQWRARALAGASINTLTLASESAARRLAAGRLAAGWSAAGRLAAGWWAAGRLAAGWLAAGGLWESARVKVKEGWNQAGLMPVRA
jgi:hypothetical protein